MCLSVGRGTYPDQEDQRQQIDNINPILLSNTLYPQIERKTSPL